MGFLPVPLSELFSSNLELHNKDTIKSALMCGQEFEESGL